MLIIGTVGATLIALSYLEKQEKIYINRNILYAILGITAFWIGKEMIIKITNTLLINI